MTPQNALQKVEPSNVLQLVEKLAQSPNLSLEQVSVIERLVALQERQEEQKRKEMFFEAHRLACAEMPRVAKNGLVKLSSGKPIYSYARLEDLDACIRPVYQRHGFSVIFDAPQAVDGKIRNVARFSCAGHTESVEITAAASNRSAGNLTLTDAQKVKQTITECRRHLLEMFFNIITEGAEEAAAEECITESQALDIRTRVNDLPQRSEGSLLGALCRKYGVFKPEEIRAGQYDAVVKDVEIEEKKRAGK